MSGHSEVNPLVSNLVKGTSVMGPAIAALRVARDGCSSDQMQLRDSYQAAINALVAPSSPGMPIEQEPKYGIRGNRLFNRASGEVIPSDEPVFIFRARDVNAKAHIAAYGQACLSEEHRAAVASRVLDFTRFAKSHPQRMKQPDTEFTLAFGVGAHANTPPAAEVLPARSKWAWPREGENPEHFWLWRRRIAPAILIVASVLGSVVALSCKSTQHAAEPATKRQPSADKPSASHRHAPGELS